MSTLIPYGRQDISVDDIDAVVEVLKSDYLTQGPCVPRFESLIVDYCSVKHAVAVNSATSALHIACLALELGPGDILWTSPISFVASANVALYCGATVDFVDINYATNNMCPKNLRAKLEVAKTNGSLPKIVVPVHMTGLSCDMKVIHELSQEYGFRIIEDASHAIGGKYKGRAVGSCSFSDSTVFSFHPVKIITTAEGGVATTNDPNLGGKMALLRSHGITRDPSLMSGGTEGDWYYQQIDLGFNYRMTEMQAALGCSQMVRLDEFVVKRNRLAAVYRKKLKGLPLSLPMERIDYYSSYHLFVIKLSPEADTDRKSLFDDLKAEGVGVNVHYIPIYAHPYYQGLGFKAEDYPASERYYNSAISIPLHPNISNESLDRIVEALLTRVFRK